MSAQKAAEDLKLLAKKFKPLLDAAEALEKVGSIENAAREAYVALMKAKSEAKLAQHALEQEQDKLYEMQELVDGAKKKAFMIEESAKQKSEVILNKANEEAKIIMTVANSSVKAMKEEVQLSEQERLSVESEIEEGKKKLAAIEDQISGMRAKIAAFVK